MSRQNPLFSFVSIFAFALFFVVGPSRVRGEPSGESAGDAEDGAPRPRVEAPRVQTDLDYSRDVAPIFRVYCAGCHNEKDLEGGLSLETYKSLREGGDDGDPIAPGDPDISALIRKIEGREKPAMPPKEEPQPPERARELLRRWVAEGAHGPAVDASILESFVAPKIATGPGSYSPATALAYSETAEILAIGRFGSVEVCDPTTYAIGAEIRDLPGKVNSIALSADGARLVVATGVAGLSGEARLYEIGGANAPPGEPATPTLLRTFGGHRDILYDAALSPDETLIATAGYDRAIRIWSIDDGRLLQTIDVHQGAIFDLEFDPSGRVLASASADETVKLWRVSDGVRLDTLNQPQGEQFTVAFTPDGEFVLSAGADRRIHVWQLVSKESPALNPAVDSRFAHESTIVALRVTGNGARVVSAAEDGSLKVWSFPALEELASYETQPDIVSAIVSSKESDAIIVARLDGSIERYALPRESAATRSVASVEVATPSPAPFRAEPATRSETEPNDDATNAESIELPVEIHGAIETPGDADLFRFRARAGDELTLEVNAARAGSHLDSKVEVLDSRGEPIEQVLLQAVRDSWFTFRGKDSSTSDDFRLHNWREMELDEYLYADGEVVRLWRYPRGPDSGFKVYPGEGARHTSFSTTALSHALGAPCYIVEPLPPGAEPPPNGLPLFPIYTENDDDPTRRFGSDSLLIFRAPRDGEYIARITDVRGFGGEKDFSYRLLIRERRPAFSISIGGKGAKVSPGSGRELGFSATRLEGFDGPIRIDIENLPEGFEATTPVIIEEDQVSAFGVVRAASDAPPPSKEATAAVRVTARATIRGEDVVEELGDLGEIGLADAAKLSVEILPRDEGDANVRRADDGRLELTIHPGETIEARVRAVRHDFAGRIELGGDDSGRNLPYGVYVDHIGLNGLLIVEGETEREFFITASPVAKPGRRLFHLRATADGGQCSAPVWVHVEADDGRQGE